VHVVPPVATGNVDRLRLGLRGEVAAVVGVDAALAERTHCRQEHEAWEVLLACEGQLRLAPSGHVIGIDAALKIAAAHVCDLAVLSELLPAAEAGLVEALRSDSVWDGGP
jgi:hypothetical protein